MVQINFAQKTVNAKIVYYGPGMSGKTTNLEVIHQRAPSNNRGDLTSISTDGDRTLFFDFMPLDLGTVAGMRTCFQIYTVPGQVYYNSTRKLVLQGVDGVVFVADSSASMQEENQESMRNLAENLAEYGRSIDDLPLVIQYNKRDLPDAMSVEDLEQLLNPRGVPSYEGVANTGQGVFPTLKALAACVIEHIHSQQRGASSGGASSTEPPPGLSRTGFDAPPTGDRPAPASIRPDAPAAQPAPAAVQLRQPRAPLPGREQGHDEEHGAMAPAEPMPQPAQAAGDSSGLRLARPAGRQPDPQAPAAHRPPSSQAATMASTGYEAPPAQRAPTLHAPPVGSAHPPPTHPPQPRLPDPGVPRRAGATGAARPQRPAAAPVHPGRNPAPARARNFPGSSAAQGPRPVPRPTPMHQNGGGRKAAVTALIVAGSVALGAVIGGIVLSQL